MFMNLSKDHLAALFALILVLALSSPLTAADMNPIQAQNMPDGVYVEIVPRLELLSGVLAYTSWMKTAGPAGEGTAYFRSLKKFLEPYKDHQAVCLAERLTRRGFTYDAPPNFILSLGPLPHLEPVNGYSDYLIRRAKGEDHLENFRQALLELSSEAEFPKFIADHRQMYQQIITQTVAGFRVQKVISWLESFFGWSGDEFHLVLAPAMFPWGGYGAKVTTPDKEQVIFQVIRANEDSKAPLFPSSDNLEYMSLHEWGHSFVNPTIEENGDLISKYNLNKFFQRVEKVMKQQAYSNVTTFLNEQVLRAITMLALRDFFSDEIYRQQIEKQEANGFYLTRFTIDQLEYYQGNRDKYPAFNLFVPYLLEQYHKNQDELLNAN